MTDVAAPPTPARDLLSRVPLLSSLDAEQLAVLSDACVARDVPAGDTVFRKGDPGDGLYIVESGTLDAVLDEGTGSEHVISRFVPGDFFGEMALLTGQPRSATVRARSEARLLTLPKTHFDRIVAADGSLALSLSRSLSARLVDANEQMSRHRTRICTLVPVGDAATTAGLLIRLMQSVRAHRRRRAVVVMLGVEPPASFGLPPGGDRLDVDAEPIPSAPAAGRYVIVSPDLLSRHSDASISARLDALRQAHHQVIVWTTADIALRRRAALHRAAGSVVIGAGAGVVSDVLRTAQALEELEAPVRVALTEEDVNRAAMLPGSPVTPIWLGGRGVERLARVTMGASVGLALSGGAAQGLAHLGVLEALLEANVPIDMIAGTSGGALYGSMLASGLSIEAAQARVIMQTRRNLMDKIDLTLPRHGIIRGRRIERMIRDAIGDVTFDQLKIPFRAVATDLENGDEVVLGQGPVYRAVRASISIPGIFEPVRIDGRLLVDGAVVTPLPVRPVRAMGADFVIAVSVPAPGRVSDERKRAAGKRLGEQNNLMSTIFRSHAFAGDVLAQHASLEADVCIRPDVALFGWRDYQSAVDIIHAGRQAGRASVEEIKTRLPVPVSAG
jgi:NTE family protein